MAGASEGIYRAGGPTANENKKIKNGSITAVGGGTWLLLALDQLKQFSWRIKNERNFERHGALILFIFIWFIWGGLRRSELSLCQLQYGSVRRPRINRIKNNPNGIKRFTNEIITKEICIMWPVFVTFSWKQVVFTIQEEFSIVDNKIIFGKWKKKKVHCLYHCNWSTSTCK